MTQTTERIHNIIAELQTIATDQGFALAFPTGYYDMSYADQEEMISDAYDTLLVYCGVV